MSRSNLVPKGFISVTALQNKRKWKVGDIVEYLGKPDKVVIDPDYKNRIRLYDLERVEDAEISFRVGLHSKSVKQREMRARIARANKAAREWNEKLRKQELMRRSMLAQERLSCRLLLLTNSD